MILNRESKNASATMDPPSVNDLSKVKKKESGMTSFPKRKEGTSRGGNSRLDGRPDENYINI